MDRQAIVNTGGKGLIAGSCVDPGDHNFIPER